MGKQTSFMLILATGGMLAGCQGNGALIGKGPLTLTPYAKNYYENVYLPGHSQQSVVAVSTDGKYLAHSNCSDVRCRTESYAYIVNYCERQYGGECKIYAIRDQIVWQFDADNEQGVAYRPNRQEIYKHQFLADWEGLFSDKQLSASFSHSMSGSLTFFNAQTGICNGKFHIDQDSAKPVANLAAAEYQGDWKVDCTKGQSAQGDVRMTVSKNGTVTHLAGTGEDDQGRPLLFKKNQ